jgi:TonB family protein
MRAPRPLSAPSALVTSAVLHGAVIALGAWLLHRSLTDRAPAVVAPSTVEVSVEESGIRLPAVSAGGLVGSPEPAALPEERPAVGPLGGEREPRPDMPRAGRAGTRESSERALNLADSVDGLSLDRDPMNRFDRSQVQRLRTGVVRASWDDRRATPNPMELSFVASGHGKLALRRPPAERDPSRGVSSGAIAAEPGGALGGPEVDDGAGPLGKPGAAELGADRATAALGTHSGAPGRDYRRSASVMLARPMVPAARAAVPSANRARPNDDTDSAQDVANAVASLIHASTAGGRRGSGAGGEPSPGKPASGGLSGPGSRSRAAGTGPGSLLDVGADSAVVGYFRGVERRLEPFWRKAFPDWAIADGRSGLVTVIMVIRRDGTLSTVSVTRGSGIDEFDRNVVAAVRKAAPFGPLPARLLPGPQPLRMTFDATNPAVGRDGPGKGQRGGS